MATATAMRPFGTSVISWFRNRIDDLDTARSRHAAFTGAYSELNKMSNAELAEFGLHRSDLVDLAWRQVDAA